MSELVLMLIPAFNAQSWLDVAIGNELAESSPRKWVLVADDGAAEETLAVTQDFAVRGVRVISQANRGAAAARNPALRVSQGTSIKYLDADDVLHRNKVALHLPGAARRRATGNASIELEGVSSE